MAERVIRQDRVPITAEIPRIQFSSGAAKSLQAFSNSMFSLSNQFEDQLDQQAAAEGTVAGGQAALGGEMPELADYGTIRGRAFNVAATEVFVTTLDTNSILKVQELSSKYPADPAALERDLGAYTNGIVEELEKTNPGAAATMRQRMAMRSAPVVEAAKDNAFKLTKDQAEAALIMNQTALKAEIKTYAGDLFSENPDRSSKAMAAIGMVQDDYMRVYQAKDPTTGRPLYSAEEQAKAKTKFYSDVMENASLSWFDSQPDKAAAYLKFTSPEFKIKLKEPGASNVKFIDNTAGKIRSKPIQATLRNQLATAAAATGDGLAIEIVSGGQNPLGVGGPRTGSERHDDGHAADVRLVRNGKPILPGEDKALYARFMENAAAAGATGLGHYSWGVHIGGGKKAAWGPNTSSNTLDPDFRAAIERGWAGPKLDGKPIERDVDLRKALPEEVMNRIDSEMRQRITFENSLADRQERLAEKDLKFSQDQTEFEFTNRMFNAGKPDPETGKPIAPLTRDDIMTGVRNGYITPGKGETLAKALVTEKPSVSDKATRLEALKRLHAGTDIRDFVFANVDKLSEADQDEFLSKNYSMNVSDEGKLTPDQTFYQSQLEKLLTPDSLLAPVDQGKQERRFSAMDEYRRRVKAGEAPKDVVDDIRERAVSDFKTIDQSKLGSMVRPRFSVQDTSKGGNRIDVQASGIALKKARDDNRITEEAYYEQMAQILRFKDVQDQLDADLAETTTKKAKK